VWSNDSVVGAGTRLCAGPQRICGSIVAAKCPHWLWDIPTLLLCVYLGGVSLGTSGGIMDHTSTSGAGTKNVWSCTSTPVSRHGKSFNSFKFKMYFFNTIPTNAFASAYVGIILIMVLMHILGKMNYLLDNHNDMKAPWIVGLLVLMFSPLFSYSGFL